MPYPAKLTAETILGAHAIGDLHQAVRHATRDRPPPEAFFAAAHSYLEYAREHPHLYALLLRPREPYVAEPGPGKELWNEVLAIVGAVTGNPDDTASAVAFWAFLHGFTLLESSGQFGVSGPRGGFERGLKALFSGFRRETA